MMNKENPITKTSLFESKQIRGMMHEEEWYLSVIDVIETLTDSENPRKYWTWLKSRELDSAVISTG